MEQQIDMWQRPAAVAGPGPIDFEVDAPQLRLLVLQPTPFCNIDCSYCYLAERQLTARMSLATVESACRRVFESGLLAPQLEIAWHGGEPLVVPVAWYEAATELALQLSPPGVRLKHHFQTNGLLLNADWARFFSRLDASIGLSIDGPADLHDANRRTRRGQGTHDDAMRAVRLLRDHNLDFHVLTVLTASALDDPDRLFDFYVQNGIRKIGFNIEEIEGIHKKSSLMGERVEQRFRSFIRRFFELVCDAPGLLQVREFENTIGLLLADRAARDEQNLPFVIVSVAHDGNFSTFSPELLGANHSRFGSFAVGHVAADPISTIVHTPRFAAINSEVRRGVEACERNCRYFRWCGGGAPANKLFETGRFDVSETMHCRLTRQIVLDEVVAGIESRTARPGLSRQPVPGALS